MTDMTKFGAEANREIPRRTRKSASDRKAEILQTTLDLAFEVGPNHVTTGMIAGKLGLTQPALYKHFPKKGDIWGAIADQLGQRVGANIARVTSTTTDPLERIRLLILGHLQLIIDTPALPEIMVMRDASANHSMVQSAIQTRMTDFRGALVGAVIAAIETGSFRRDIAPKDAETLIFGVIQSLVLRLMITRNTAILLEDGPRLLDLQLSGFAKS
ncbi:MAG: TetR/AcrR family transcriptional regulator [Rhodobacterales bacterium]|nr:TetR/AcrR family transcriptional regulator [Rhodobacterales bacterium]